MIITEFINFFANSSVQTIVILIIVDVILGIVAAFLKKEFVIGKVAAFVKKGFITYVFGFVVVEIVGQALPSLAMIVPVAFWLIVVALVGSILANLERTGVKLPKILTR